MSLIHNSGSATNVGGLQLLLDASNPKSWSVNTHPHPLDLYAYGAGGNGHTGARDYTTTSPAGGIPYKMTITGNDPYVGSYNSPAFSFVSASAGETWTASVYVRATTPTEGTIFLFGADTNGTYIETGTNVVPIGTSWTRIWVTKTLTNPSTVAIQTRVDGPDANGVGIELWWDGMQVERGSTMTAFNPKTNPNGRTWFDISGNNRHFTWSTSAAHVNNGTSSYFNTLGNTCQGPASNSFGINNATGYTIITAFSTQTAVANSAFKFFNDDAVGYNRGIFLHPGWSTNDVIWDNGGCCVSSQRVQTQYGSSIMSAMNVHTFSSRLYDRRMFLNGDVTNTNNTYSANINLNSTPVELTNSEHFNGSWDGKLSYFALYNTGLPDTTIRNLSHTVMRRLG